MSEDSEERDPGPRTCAVCGRGLLPGERPATYVTREGSEALVCELCKPRAEAAGWMRPEEAAAQRAGGGGRERRRSRGQMFSGLLAKRPTAAPAGDRDREPEPDQDDSEATDATVADPPPPRRRRAERPERPSRATSARSREGSGRGEEPAGGGEPAIIPAPAPTGDSPGTTLQEAIAAFNASDHRRTVAGLIRTLGPPRASGLAVRASSGYPGARLTVAWEITWYQWEVGPGKSGPEVREVGKGETIDQLRAADRTWNLHCSSDGTLEQRSGETGSAKSLES